MEIKLLPHIIIMKAKSFLKIISKLEAKDYNFSRNRKTI